MSDSIMLAGCAGALTCPSIAWSDGKLRVTGVDVNGDGVAESTVEISRELFDRAVAKLIELEAPDGETR